MKSKEIKVEMFSKVLARQDFSSEYPNTRITSK